jgi:succinate-semialdehyde dehydrogenase/glutarate-semialdehyde dehydrogenase
MPYRSVNPYNGKVLETFEELTDAQLEKALATAATCFEKWRRTTFSERAAVVTKAAAIMRSRINEFARPVTLEMGKLFDQARGEVELSANIIDYYAQNAERFLAPEHLKPSSGEAVVESSPIGVIFGVQPWNCPYYQLARFAAPNLMAGNVVMVKHAGCVPQCAIAFEKLWLDAGAPEGAYTNLLISHDQVNRVIDDPRIKGVALTGSVEAGKSVAGRAGRNLKKSTMELGGSDAFIVLEDADLDKTVKWAMWGKMNNTGQCCVAAKRFIVVEELADRFLGKFQTALAALEPGDPLNANTTLGPSCPPTTPGSSRGGRRQRRHLCDGGQTHRPPRLFHAGDDSGRHQATESGVQRGILRSCCALFRRQERGRRSRACQQLEFRLRRFGVYKRHSARQAHCQPR